MLLKNKPLILASASPRRSELLKLAGIEFEVRPVEVDENLLPAETPEAHVLRLAQAKATAAQKEFPSNFVLAADTIVTLDSVIMGKPKDKADAASMLEKLSGRSHQVMTGYCLANQQAEICELDFANTEVWFRTLTPSEIDRYVDSGEPMDKAGAYAIQGFAAGMVKKINGSYTNVVGLPLSEVVELLKRYFSI